VEEQFIGLFSGGLAVIARDGHCHVIRHESALDGLEALEQLVGDGDRIGALALGESNRHRRQPLELAVLSARQGPSSGIGLRRADDDTGNVLDIDRPLVARGQ
jgi:hypothetical protein